MRANGEHHADTACSVGTDKGTGQLCELCKDRGRPEAEAGVKTYRVNEYGVSIVGTVAADTPNEAAQEFVENTCFPSCGEGTYKIRVETEDKKVFWYYVYAETETVFTAKMIHKNPLAEEEQP